MPEQAISSNDNGVKEKLGLCRMGGTLVVVGLWLFFAFGQGTPLIDESAAAEAQFAPFMKLGGRLLLYFCWQAGPMVRAPAPFRSSEDLVRVMTGAMESLAYYLVPPLLRTLCRDVRLVGSGLDSGCPRCEFSETVLIYPRQFCSP